MNRLLMSGVAVAALMAFGSMAAAQQAQQPVQTMPSQGGGAQTDTQGGSAGTGAQTQMPEDSQSGQAQQKSSDSMEKSSDTNKKSSDTNKKSTEKSSDTKKKSSD